MDQIKKSFISAEAAKLSGMSRYMVDYLCRTGVVRPSSKPEPGRGRHRRYLFGDVVLLRSISGLLKTGLPVRRLKVAIDRVRKNDFKGLTATTDIARFLITDGKDVWLRESPSVLIDLTARGQLAFAFVVDIKDAREQVLAEARKEPRRYFAVAS